VIPISMNKLTTTNTRNFIDKKILYSPLGDLLGKSRTWAINKAGTKIALDGEPSVQKSKFSEGLLPVRINKVCGYVDKTGKIAIDPQWDFLGNFHEGLAAVHCKIK